MQDLITATWLVLLNWLLMFVFFMGVGLLVRRLFGLHNHSAQALVSAFWVGWAASIAGLQGWQIAFKLDWRATALIGLAGLAGLAWNARDLRPLVRCARQKYALTFFVPLLLVALWAANQALDVPADYDSGLYHLQSVRWLTTYPLVPGLGNLHGRLAFNSSYFLYVGMLDVGPWASRSYHVANGLLLMAVCAQSILSAVQLIAHHERRSLAKLFSVLVFGPAIMLAATGQSISSPAPDPVVFVLGLALSVFMLAFLERDHYDTAEAGYDLLVITALAAVGITVKLSFAAFGAVTVVTLLGVWCYRTRPMLVEGRAKARRLAWLAVTVMIVIVPWMVRGVILSGYIAYPSTLGAVDVEWRVSRERAINEADVIRSWARNEHEESQTVLANWDWFKPWLERTSRLDGVKLPLVMVAAAVVLALYRRIDARRFFMRSGRCTLLLAPAAASLVFWFFLAPDYRFAGASFWVLGLGALLLALAEHLSPAQMVPVVLALAIGLTLLNPVDLANPIGPGADAGFHSAAEVALTTFETESGLVINVPTDTDQCWDAPLPCSPSRPSRLRLRKPGNLRQGFVVEPVN